MGDPATTVEAVLADCAKQLAALLSALREEPDPRVRLVSSSQALQHLREEAARVAELRDAAIADLVAAGSTYQQIADASGITRGRVAHIVSEGRNGD
jgi:DNA-directed RNA polymerase specialized sigma24 family protein